MISRNHLASLVGFTVLLFFMVGCSPVTEPILSTKATATISPTPTDKIPGNTKHILQDINATDVHWSDGSNIIYATMATTPSNTCCQWERKRLDLQSMQTEMLDVLQDSPDAPIKLDWLDRPILGSQMSPNEDRVVYNRTPLDFVPSPSSPSKPAYKEGPMELWTAKMDGSEPTRLWAWLDLGCHAGMKVAWFSNEEKALVTCIGYDGGVFQRVEADLANMKAQSFSQWLGIPNEDGSRDRFLPFDTTPSPDNGLVAYNSGKGELWLAHIDSHAAPQKIADLGFYPQWSTDSTRLYFLSADQSGPNEIPELTMYDVIDKKMKIVLDRSSIKKASDLAGITFGITSASLWDISPSENAILVKVGNGIWLVEW